MIGRPTQYSQSRFYELLWRHDPFLVTDFQLQLDELWCHRQNLMKWHPGIKATHELADNQLPASLGPYDIITDS